MKPQVENAMKILRGEKADIPFILWSPAPFICAAVKEPQSEKFYMDAQHKMDVQLKAIEMFSDMWTIPGVWPDFGLFWNHPCSEAGSVTSITTHHRPSR